MRIGIQNTKVLFIIRIASFVLLSIINAELFAQEVKVRAGFFEDSVIVGDVARFYLTASYPSKVNVLFPDSAFKFNPLEYESREYFATRTTNGISYDSVIYHLSVFEVDSLQQLLLPVFVVNENDCTQVLSAADTIILNTVVHDIKIDSIELGKLPLKESLAFHKMTSAFNYPVFFFVVASVLIVIAVAWFVFGKRVQKYFKMKRMIKAHQQFIHNFGREIGKVQASHTAVVTESTVAQWKKYMEQLERKPYTKLTSKEIQRIERNEGLGKILHRIDASIYGHQDITVSLFEELKAYAQERFNKKLEEVKNG